MKFIAELEDFYVFHDTGLAYVASHPDKTTFPRGLHVQTGVIRTDKNNVKMIDYQAGVVCCAEGDYKIKSFCNDPNVHNIIYPGMIRPSNVFTQVKKLILDF